AILFGKAILAGEIERLVEARSLAQLLEDEIDGSVEDPADLPDLAIEAGSLDRFQKRRAPADGRGIKKRRSARLGACPKLGPIFADDALARGRHRDAAAKPVATERRAGALARQQLDQHIGLDPGEFRDIIGKTHGRRKLPPSFKIAHENGSDLEARIMSEPLSQRLADDSITGKR